jgi:hypothetical protein
MLQVESKEYQIGECLKKFFYVEDQTVCHRSDDVKCFVIIRPYTNQIANASQNLRDFYKTGFEKLRLINTNTHSSTAQLSFNVAVNHIEHDATERHVYRDSEVSNEESRICGFSPLRCDRDCRINSVNILVIVSFSFGRHAVNVQ